MEGVVGLAARDTIANFFGSLSLYLDGTLDHLVEMGLLEKHAEEGEEATFSVDTDTAVFEAAVAFDDAIAGRLVD